MPLLDHFHPPLIRTHPWQAFHGAWATFIAQWLNDGVLPHGYYAIPFLNHPGPVEIDVAALRTPEPVANGPGNTRAWAPDAPGLAVAVEWPTADDARVEVFSDHGDPSLIAAVELVSPSNKDRPRSREAFTAKCVDYLRRGCGLVVVDAVTNRRADLHADLLAALGVDPGQMTPSTLSVASYRSVGRDAAGQLLAWPAALEIGRPLPTVPLWLGADLAVPLDLEASYTTTCEELRVPSTSIPGGRRP